MRKLKRRTFNALGVESGIGSMLIGAKKIGYNIVGNIESRNDFHTGTFENNFPGAFMCKSFDGSIPGISLLMAHPKCGSFSSMGWANVNGKKDISSDHGNFPLVVKYINVVKPRFFLIDNLPRALEASPLNWWRDQLEGYKMNVEMVSNYNYGNVQLKRNRVFIMGWLEDENFVFRAGEENNDLKVIDIIGDLLGTSQGLNHNVYSEDMKAPNMSPLTVKEASEFFDGEKEGRNPKYYRNENDKVVYVKQHDEHKFSDLKTRIGTKKLRWNSHGQTLTSNTNIYHPLRLTPLTCRERARIMGFEDDFEFIFANEKDSLTKRMGCQTAQAVPIQFTTYFAKQVMCHLKGEIFASSGHRFVHNDLVQESKQGYCKKYGFTKNDCIACAYKHCYVKNL